MTFYEVLEQALALLQRHKRVSYRALKLQFHLLSDDALKALKDELIYQRVARDEDGKGLVWTGKILPAGAPTTPAPAQRPTSDAAVTTRSVEQTPSWSLQPTAVPSTRKGTAPDEPIRPSPEAERRQLTVVFCDLADSTTLAQQLDPEDLREVIRAYQQTSAEVIQQYEGHLAQYLGDGLLIYFGWPVAHEDDAQRAAHAGLGIVEAITTTLNPRLAREKSMQLTMRIGMHTGPVVVGEMGGGRHEHLATGDTVNIAARLEGLAAPNTVVMSSVTARLVERAFALEDLGPQVLKGVAEPMQVFRVRGPREVHEDERPTGGIPFLVGRDEEAGLLLRRWDQSKEGLGQVVLISGEAGIGKSSLVATVRHHVVEAGYTRMTFRCSPYHTNSAFYPVITHLEHMLCFARGDTPDVKLDTLEHVLRATRLPLEQSVPLMASLLSVPLDQRHPALHLSPQQQRQQTLHMLVDWLIEAAARQPALVVWEDVHWADPSTLDLLGLILEQTPTVPMLHVLTFRPEFEPPWSPRSHMTPLTLNRLERPQVEALITYLARGKTLPAEVVQHIVTKTDGVPFYVEELTKMLLTSELLREEADQYVLNGPLTTVAIPDTLQDSLMARLDRLHTAKELAQLGAVLGREFPYEMLQAIASQDEELLQAGLVQLVEAELLYQRGRPPRATYIFKHALIQDAAYASLLRSTRQRVHQQIAQLLETRFPETVATQPELLAYHYTEAGQDEHAIPYWQRAGNHALQRPAYAEAIGHLTQGLTMLATQPETPTRLHQELDLQVALGRALRATKGNAAPEVERAYARARELCQQLGDSMQLLPVLQGLIVYYQGRGQFQTAYQLAEQLLRLAHARHDSALLLVAHNQLGAALFFRGEPAAAQPHRRQALEIYTPQEHQALAFREGLPDLGVLNHIYRAWDLWSLGYPDQALQYSQTARLLAQDTAHPFSLMHALVFSAVLHQFRREASTTREMAAAAMTLATDQGFAYLGSLGTVLHGWALAMQARGEVGRGEIRQGLATYLDLGTKLWQPHSLSLLAEAYGETGSPDEGLPLLAEALAVLDTMEGHFYAAEVYRLQGALLLKQAAPDASQAGACFQTALDVARAQRAKSWELRAAMSLARLWHQQGKRQVASDLLAPVYNWFTEGFDTADLQEAKALLDTMRE